MFDPNKPFEVLEREEESVFDPNLPFDVIEEEDVADPSAMQTPLDESSSDPRDFGNFSRAQVGNLFGEAINAGKGLAKAIAHPVDTAESIGEALTLDDEALQRMVRATPLVGDAVTGIKGSIEALGGLVRGGPEEGERARNEYLQGIREKDELHAEEHPLTDFLQRSLPYAAVPPALAPQLGTLALDVFNKSIQAGNDAYDAMRDARNSLALYGGMIGVGKGVGAGYQGAKNVLKRDAKVTDQAIARYREDPAAINEAAQYVNKPDQLKAMVDQRYKPFTADVERAKFGLEDAKTFADQRKKAPLEIGSELTEHLRGQSKKLGEMSLDSYGLLKEGENFPIKNVLNEISNQQEMLKIGGVVPTQGPDAGAYHSLESLKNMISQMGIQTPQGIAGDLSGPVVKDIVRHLDRISQDAYSRPAGSLSPLGARELAGTRNYLDQEALKISEPYRQKMAELAPRVSNVDKMSALFGTEEKALSSLTAAKDPLSPHGHTVRSILREYDSLNKTDFLPRIDHYFKTAQEGLLSARKDLSTAKSRAADYSLLSPGSTENTVKSIQAGRNIEAGKQLSNLDPELLQLVQDVGVASQFERPTINGSRRAVIGKGLGTALGSLVAKDPIAGTAVGYAAGGALGGLADLYGGHTVKKVLDAGIKLDRLANSKFVGPVIRAAQESPQALAVTKYLLSKDPEFKALNEDANMSRLENSKEDL